MGLARLYSRALRGLDAPEVIVEVHVANGLPGFSIVGLPDVEVKESRDRVRSAIQMSGFEFPARRITVNLAPADLPKDSGRYDLPIALGILLASGLVKAKLDLECFEFAGELALNGELRRISGALAIAYSVSQGPRSFILPIQSAAEACLVDGITVFAAQSLNQVVQHLTAECNLLACSKAGLLDDVFDSYLLDFNQVKGQMVAKQALVIAASGRHSVLLIGNPGCGKSMLAERLTTILPPLTQAEAMSSAAISSLASGEFKLSEWKKIPMRSPHHGSSSVAIVGGGSLPRPGEISLAHNGVLFLDEMPEFERKVLEALREPLESKRINISRARHKVEFPADFQLVGAMNPCPCGNNGHPRSVCRCSPEQITRYISKLSAPLIDRIDLIVEMPYLKAEELEVAISGESSQQIRKRVVEARTVQLERQGKLNYALTNSEIDRYCVLEPEARQLLFHLSEKTGMSVRTYYKLLKVARTIADISNKKVIDAFDISQSTQYKKSFN